MAADTQESLVAGLLAPVVPEALPLSARERALLGYAQKLTLTPAAIVAADILSLRAAGLDDLAIHDACAIVAYFAFVNRIADGLGVELESRPERAGRVPSMRVQLKKTADGRPSLACVRADGSRTWSRVHPFFPLHDLTHYSVESVLGMSSAFFGLIASGWEIDQFAEAGAAGRLPTEAIIAECVVGLLDLERSAGHVLGEAEFDAALASSLAGQGPEGGTLDLPFPAAPGQG
jgi:hypothetical protein